MRIEGQIETIKLITSQTDENGNIIHSERTVHISQKKVLLLFAQNELLEAYAKEIFMQQLSWLQVKEKRWEDCKVNERIFKQMPRAPSCSDVVTQLFDSFEMRSQRSPDRSITYKTCLGKLERMVKAQWDEWRLKQSKSSF